MRYSIHWNNTRRFDHAYYPTDCVGCEAPIDEGDKIGRIHGEEGYLCIECINDFGDDGHVKVKPT